MTCSTIESLKTDEVEQIMPYGLLPVKVPVLAQRVAGVLGTTVARIHTAATIPIAYIIH